MKIFMKQKAVCEEVDAPIIQSINVHSQPSHVKKIRGVRYNQRSFLNSSPQLKEPPLQVQLHKMPQSEMTAKEPDLPENPERFRLINKDNKESSQTIIKSESAKKSPITD